MAWQLITQFIAANTASMGLLLGSPSNIILGDAVGLTFLRYWGLMMLPTLVAVASTLVMIVVVFVWLPTRGHVMQRRFDPPQDVQEDLAAMELPTTSPSTAAPQAPEPAEAPAEATSPPSEPRVVVEDEEEEALQEHSLLVNPRVRRAKVRASDPLHSISNTSTQP